MYINVRWDVESNSILEGGGREGRERSKAGRGAGMVGVRFGMFFTLVFGAKGTREAGNERQVT